MDSLPLILISAVTVAVVYLLFTKISSRLNDLQKGKDDAQAALNISLNERLDRIMDTVLKQVNESGRTTDTRAKEVRDTMTSNAKTLEQLTAKLAQMEEANKRIFDVGKDISGLQEILRAPKLRGTLGELFLGDLLGEILPDHRFKLQYAFQNNEIIDAVIFLKDNRLVPIDAKFPLESFKRMLESPDEVTKKSSKKQFNDSVKKRIDEIASKYILADEGTMDFALMYIPAENVYYETIVKGETDADLTKYAYSKRVIPVSPNNLYVYLQTIMLGLRGMQIEQSAREILQDLSRLSTDFQKVSESYEVLGKHIQNAAAKYDDTERILTKYNAKVEQIEAKTRIETQVLESGENKPIK